MPAAPSRFAVAPFRCDITPPVGHPLLGGLVPPAAAVADPLEALGFVLLGAGAPVVVCVLDWAALMNRGHLEWREALAAAAGTTPDRVAVQCVHQHATPFVCPEAREIIAGQPGLPELHDPAFVDACRRRAAAALSAALACPVPVSHVGHASTRVERVAGNRRVARDPSGRVRAMRLSSCTDPELIALPEGLIDPDLQTVFLCAAAPRPDCRSRSRPSTSGRSPSCISPGNSSSSTSSVPGPSGPASRSPSPPTGTMASGMYPRPRNTPLGVTRPASRSATPRSTVCSPPRSAACSPDGGSRRIGLPSRGPSR